MALQKTFKVQGLDVSIYNDKASLGKAAAELVGRRLKKIIQKKGRASVILATGASQFEFIDALKTRDDIDWEKITVFHLDEYKGISENHPASFRKYLKERILNLVKPGQVHFINGDAEDSIKECERYEALLKRKIIDVACVGIGENGHLAFNDPSAADFHDKKLVKVAALDEDCRKQQLGEGWFKNMDEVPLKAITLTIPAIMSAGMISCVVPDARKARAVKNALEDDISPKCPATVLRRHHNAYLFLDTASAALIK